MTNGWSIVRPCAAYHISGRVQRTDSAPPPTPADAAVCKALDSAEIENGTQVHGEHGLAASSRSRVVRLRGPPACCSPSSIGGVGAASLRPWTRPECVDCAQAAYRPAVSVSHSSAPISAGGDSHAGARRTIRKRREARHAIPLATTEAVDRDTMTLTVTLMDSNEVLGAFTLMRGRMLASSSASSESPSQKWRKREPESSRVRGKARVRSESENRPPEAGRGSSGARRSGLRLEKKRVGGRMPSRASSMLSESTPTSAARPATRRSADGVSNRMLLEVCGRAQNRLQRSGRGQLGR